MQTSKTAMLNRLLVLAVVLLAGAPGAYASNCATPASGINICYTQGTETWVSGGTYAPTIANQLANPYDDTAGLNATTTAQTFLSFGPPGGGSGTVVYTQVETFNVTGAGGYIGTAEVTATYTANYTTTLDTLDWSIYGDGDTADSSCSGNPGTVTNPQTPATNACTVVVDLSNGSSTEYLEIKLNSAYDWTMTPQIAFEQVSTPPPNVPEPASLALFGTALVGFGLMRRRRQRV